MNANEVISNRAIELLGGDRMKAEKPVHPNDHVNMGQSTNDMFPTAIHVAVAAAIENRTAPGPGALHGVLKEKAAAVGQDHQNRPHPSGRRYAAAAGAGNRWVRPPD